MQTSIALAAKHIVSIPCRTKNVANLAKKWARTCSSLKCPAFLVSITTALCHKTLCPGNLAALPGLASFLDPSSTQQRFVRQAIILYELTSLQMVLCRQATQEEVGINIMQCSLMHKEMQHIQNRAPPWSTVSIVLAFTSYSVEKMIKCGKNHGRLPCAVAYLHGRMFSIV